MEIRLSLAHPHWSWRNVLLNKWMHVFHTCCKGFWCVQIWVCIKSWIKLAATALVYAAANWVKWPRPSRAVIIQAGVEDAVMQPGRSCSSTAPSPLEWHNLAVHSAEGRGRPAAQRPGLPASRLSRSDTAHCDDTASNHNTSMKTMKRLQQLDALHCCRATQLVVYQEAQGKYGTSDANIENKLKRARWSRYVSSENKNRINRNYKEVRLCSSRLKHILIIQKIICF